MERRRHRRVYTAIPVKYHVQMPETPAISRISFGVLQNISYSGLYFRSNDIPSLEKGQIRDFTFTSTKEHPNFPEATFIIAKGRVVRIDPPEPGRQDKGVALEFVSVKFIDNHRDKSL
jgi:c-di-GMP-binding flagellar brake protein YcgR